MYTETITATFIGGDPEHAAQLEVRLEYSPLAPYTIHFRFAGQPEWKIGRDLVIAGLAAYEWVGDGDVRLCRLHDEYLVMRLESPNGVATLGFPLVDISRFVARSMLTTPLGDELLPTDAALAALTTPIGR